jgi:anti-sigma-K factor RskA
MREDLHTFAGAYVLDALSDDDRWLFEGHLAQCQACAQEVRGMRETTVRLATAVAEPPPPGLKAAVLTRIGEVRQVAPKRSADMVRTRSRWMIWMRLRPRFVAGLATGLAAACLALAVVEGLAMDRAQRRLDQAEAANQAVAAVISAPDARTVTGTVTKSGTASVVVSRSRGQIVFASTGLLGLPPSQTYELWLMGPGRSVRPAGLLRPDGTGHMAPAIAGELRGAERVGLTIEPAAGSAQPTTAPIVVLRL